MPRLARNRFEPDGDLDARFSGDGVNTAGFAGSANVTSIALAADGKVVLAGQVFATQAALARFNADGSLDNTFGSNGTQRATLNGAMAMRLQTDGKILLAGYKSGSGSATDFAMHRYTAAGVLDTTFDADGKLSTDIAGGIEQAYAIAIGSGDEVAGGLNCRRRWPRRRRFRFRRPPVHPGRPWGAR